MSCKVIFGLFIYGIYFCSANYVEMGDDKSNWEAVWKGMKGSSADSRSGDRNIFDRILRINAEERGSGKRRSDDKVFLFEGDIQMNRDDVVNMVQNDEKSRQTRAAIINNGRNLWGRNVPYAIDGVLSGQSNIIKRAVNEIERTLNCLGRWQDVTSTRRPTDYMYFFQGQGCYSFIGKRGGRQGISIGRGCATHGIVVHEIGHALGFFHEQSRPDRDNYVEIKWENIIESTKSNFRKALSSQVNSFGISYDYGSVMHYGAYAFSKNGRPTIVSKRGNVQLGQRNGLSDKDKEELRRLYGCTTTVTSTVKPTVNVCQGNVRPDWICNIWRRRGYCQGRFANYMNRNCCKACGTAVSSCTDRNTSGNCSTWARRGFCSRSSRFYSYMKRNCAKSCGCI